MHEDACVANLYKEFVADRFQPIAPSSLAIAYRLAEVYNANCQDMISARSIDAYLLIICGYIKRKRVSHDTIIITMFSTIEFGLHDKSDDLYEESGKLDSASERNKGGKFLSFDLV